MPSVRNLLQLAAPGYENDDTSSYGVYREYGFNSPLAVMLFTGVLASTAAGLHGVILGQAAGCMWAPRASVGR